MASALYQSGWNPVGAKKSWERCSMDIPSAAHFLANVPSGDAKMVECVGWFDDNGAAKIVVADYDNGRRTTVRLGARTTKIQFSRVP